MKSTYIVLSGLVVTILIAAGIYLMADGTRAVSASEPTGNNQHNAGEDTMSEKIEKTDAEWRDILSPVEYNVLRKKGTEPPFTGEFNKFHGTGVFTCAACGLSLFDSGAKFDSGTGWPSFYQPIAEKHVAEKSDSSYGMVRTEVLCARCGGHLGHVFDDGPKPTGLRYCINSVALNFEEKQK